MGTDDGKLQESMDRKPFPSLGTICEKKQSNRQHCRFHAGKPRRGDIRAQTLGILSNKQTWTSIEFKTVIMSNKNRYSSS